METLRDRLRGLPTFPAELPVFHPASVPDDPIDLVHTWLDDAIASGERQPNAMAVITVDEAGAPCSRTLIVKDIDQRGIHFSSSRRSRKAAQLAANPVAGMLFFWRALGRQLEVTGIVTALDEQTSALDWRERPTYAGVDNPDWQVWALQPARLEFLQATHDRKHVRVEYTRDDLGRWGHRLIAPSE